MYCRNGDKLPNIKMLKPVPIMILIHISIFSYFYVIFRFFIFGIFRHFKIKQQNKITLQSYPDGNPWHGHSLHKVSCLITSDECRTIQSWVYIPYIRIYVATFNKQFSAVGLLTISKFLTSDVRNQ